MNWLTIVQVAFLATVFIAVFLLYLLARGLRQLWEKEKWVNRKDPYIERMKEIDGL